LHRSGRHRFLAESPSLVEASFCAHPFQLHRDTTDRYLLRLAIHHDGQLLTLDAGIRPADAEERDALLLLKSE
jgi:PIN domain nuclease of toxin-antitoxin system